MGWLFYLVAVRSVHLSLRVILFFSCYHINTLSTGDGCLLALSIIPPYTHTYLLTQACIQTFSFSLTHTHSEGPARVVFWWRWRGRRRRRRRRRRLSWEAPAAAAGFVCAA